MNYRFELYYYHVLVILSGVCLLSVQWCLNCTSDNLSYLLLYDQPYK